MLKHDEPSEFPWLTQRLHIGADISPHGAAVELGHSDPNGWCQRWPPGCLTGSRKQMPWLPRPSPLTARHHPAGRTLDSCRGTDLSLVNKDAFLQKIAFIFTEFFLWHQTLRPGIPPQLTLDRLHSCSTPTPPTRCQIIFIGCSESVMIFDSFPDRQTSFSSNKGWKVGRHTLH